MKYFLMFLLQSIIMQTLSERERHSLRKTFLSEAGSEWCDQWSLTTKNLAIFLILGLFEVHAKTLFYDFWRLVSAFIAKKQGDLQKNSINKRCLELDRKIRFSSDWTFIYRVSWSISGGYGFKRTCFNFYPIHSDIARFSCSRNF